MSVHAILENGRVVITAQGLDLLRLKSRINQAAGQLVTKGERKNSFSFPASLLPLVAEELPTNGLDPAIHAERDLFVAHEEARQRVQQILAADDPGTHSSPWLEILDPMQAVAVHAMAEPNLLGFCLFDEQGSGKTVMGMASFDTLKERGSIEAAIIVCPKTLVGSWEVDFNKFLPNKYKIVTADGTPQERFDKMTGGFDVLLTTYEGVAPSVTILRAQANRRRTLLIVDESFFVKNPDAARTNSLLDLRSSCARCFVLCGTPAPNSYNDVVTQFDLADRGYTFAGHSSSSEPYDDSVLVQDKMDSRGTYLRRVKSVILPNLPPKVFHVKTIALSGRQAGLYSAAKEDLALKLRSMDNKSFRKELVHYFQKRAALLQLCSCPRAVDPLFHQDHAKILAVDELLQLIIDTGGRKALLWSFYRQNLEETFSRYARYNPVKVDGRTSQLDRKSAVARFQMDPAVRLFIGNPAAAGAGLTLHAASDAIYMSFSNQTAHHLQSIDRIHRRGQTALETNYHFIVCARTIEVPELARLRRKEQNQSKLLGDLSTVIPDLDAAINELEVE